MDIPSEFDDFCLWFHQDVPDVVSDQPREVARYLLAQFRGQPQRLLRLRSFLDYLRSGAMPWIEIDALWRKTNAEVSFRNEGAFKEFMSVVVDVIDEGALA